MDAGAGLSPPFTPNRVNILLPHFIAAANDLVQGLGGQPSADLSDAYQMAALNAVLRALFSMPDQAERDSLGNLVRQYVTGPGRPQIFDSFSKSENAFAFALGGRRAFQKRWFAAVDAIVAAHGTARTPVCLACERCTRRAACARRSTGRSGP